MKLIFCLHCHDVVRLRKQERCCFCGASGGRYLDDLNAEIFGPCIPLGFANPSLAKALRSQPQGPGKGRRFEAFVIPRVCPTITKIDRAINVRQPGEPSDVHTEHCCIIHGCKYGDSECTVVTKQRRQSGPCEECCMILEGYGPEEPRTLVQHWLEHGALEAEE